eukprot:TRINITY_DN2445_c0_g1_i10.p1 TRINITY_DN2445_c0_g1~~TRINITY_DN2445_c0_g1_i10.p1  ORF type:complete len:447 (-),score=51.32 TRINITY_DN2445_c0_g1_i10:1129-2316(-)
MSQTISLHFDGRNYSPFPFPENFEALEKEISQLIKVDVGEFVLEYTHKDTEDDLAFGNNGGYQMAGEMGKHDKYGVIVKVSRKVPTRNVEVPSRKVREYLSDPLPDLVFDFASASSTSREKSTGEKTSTFRTVKVVEEYTRAAIVEDFQDLSGWLDELTEAQVPVRDESSNHVFGHEACCESEVHHLILRRLLRLEWFKDTGFSFPYRPASDAAVDQGLWRLDNGVDLPIEVKKPAALPPTLYPCLEEWACSGWGTSHSRNHLEQIYGYMNVTGCKWGVLITYPYMYIVKRIDDAERRVAVSRAIHGLEEKDVDMNDTDVPEGVLVEDSSEEQEQEPHMLELLYLMCRRVADADPESELDTSFEEDDSEEEHVDEAVGESTDEDYVPEDDDESDG